MIDPKGKACNALWLKIEAAGVHIYNEDGVLKSTNDAAAQAVIDAFTLAEAITAKQNEVFAFAAAKRQKVVAGVSPGEMSAWSVKLEQAQKYNLSKLATDAPMLQAEATARGTTLDSVVMRVLNNAQTFSNLEAQISGNSGKHRDALGALIDFASVAAYDYSTGWPAV